MCRGLHAFASSVAKFFQAQYITVRVLCRIQLPLFVANLASHNPLSRRVLGKSAKAARKAERKRARVAGTRRNGGMEVDNDGGGDSALEFTFMAGLGGIHG